MAIPAAAQADRWSCASARWRLARIGAGEAVLPLAGFPVSWPALVERVLHSQTTAMGDGFPPGPSAGGQGPDEGAGGPVLRLLARGLELWLRQQCDAIDDLQIQLEGSAVQLVRGRLEGVRLQARGVVFQQLRFERVELRSTPLQVRMGALLRSQTFRLDHPFEITGTVVFSAEGLSHSLCTQPWSELGDALAVELLGRGPLAGLRLEGERLILCGATVQHGPLERATRLQIEEGGLVLCSEADGPAGVATVAHLPRDANIHFERAQVRGGALELQGRARVTT